MVRGATAASTATTTAQRPGQEHPPDVRCHSPEAPCLPDHLHLQTGCSRHPGRTRSSPPRVTSRPTRREAAPGRRTPPSARWAKWGRIHPPGPASRFAASRQCFEALESDRHPTAQGEAMGRVWKFASLAMRLDVAVLLGFAAIDAVGNLLAGRLPLSAWSREFAFSILEFGPALIVVRLGRRCDRRRAAVGTVSSRSVHRRRGGLQRLRCLLPGVARLAGFRQRLSRLLASLCAAGRRNGAPCSRRARPGARPRGAAGQRPSRGRAAGGPRASARGADRASFPLQHAGQHPPAGTGRPERRHRDAHGSDRVPRDVAAQPPIGEHHAGAGARAPRCVPPAAWTTVRTAAALRYQLPRRPPPLPGPLDDAPHPGRELDPARARALTRGRHHRAVGRGGGSCAPGHGRRHRRGHGRGKRRRHGAGECPLPAGAALWRCCGTDVVPERTPGVRASLRLPLTSELAA